MSARDDLPVPDQIDGAPHPREAPVLFGQGVAEAAFLQAFNSGRLHHGWMLCGPRGVGKATLAWKLARFLLATPPPDGGMFAAPAPATLDIPEDHPVARRLRAGADGGLLVIRRGHDDKGNLKRDITVDVMRKLQGFFGLSAPDGGRRVVIIDAADEMNPNAANALLKALEEPPSNATLLLVAHQPSRLLPTIRSRCRELRLMPLDAADMGAALAQAGVEADSTAMAELSGGSVGAAITLAQAGGAEIYETLVKLFHGLPRLDRQAALALAESAAGKANDARFAMILTLFDLFMARMARAGITGPGPEAVPGEAALFSRLAPHAGAARAYADLSQRMGARSRHGRAVNLDPAALVLDMVWQTEAEARKFL
ncbi:DNA polymerase-3 subunit delta' [Roseinatronobacter thiooxidans]|uniref:DNA polymerase-3 subunit delta n=1 Tax=Roseinatronobacter thiooxidans TaxID=121821 RepID=A0A2W7SC99_9RHOB|nr:DNA polymerase III subunit delta' [Roseinatronobacter thiooxidans]PZX48242.1 DNA polymerase-3 subunit delta' [Roseinatronobacter thiooxidans]